MSKLTHKQIWNALHPTNSFVTVVQELTKLGLYAADYMPSAVVKERIIKRGKNAGKRHITYDANYTMTAGDLDAAFFALTGLSKDQYVKAHYFFKNSKGQTMFSLVLVNPTYRPEYKAEWMEVWKRDNHLRSLINMDLIDEELDMTNYA